MTNEPKPSPDGLTRKERGIRRVASKNFDFLRKCRNYAALTALERGHVSGDDIREFTVREGMKPTHPNAYGAVFKAHPWDGHHWHHIRFMRSRTPSAHARIISVWATRKDI
jgi:hypothetical protein